MAQIVDKAKETYELVLKIFANRNCIFSLENLRAILIEVYEILFRSIRVRRTWATHESVKGGHSTGEHYGTDRRKDKKRS